MILKVALNRTESSTNLLRKAADSVGCRTGAHRQVFGSGSGTLSTSIDGKLENWTCSVLLSRPWPSVNCSEL